MSEELTFDDLRAANIARQEHWGGSDNWTLADWSNALAGEVGEACNVVKKIRRPQLGTVGNSSDAATYYEQLETEIGDVLIYLDLLAKAAGMELSTCVMRAFNEKSEKLGMPVRLAAAPTGPAQGWNEAARSCAKLIEDGVIRKVAVPYRNDGVPSKNDRCEHGRWMYEDCEACCAVAIRALAGPEPHSGTCDVPSSSPVGGIDGAEGWFRLQGDARLGECATEGCGGQPTWRLEIDGIGADYCSGCRAAIRELRSAAPAPRQRVRRSMDATPMTYRRPGNTFLIGLAIVLALVLYHAIVPAGWWRLW